MGSRIIFQPCIVHWAPEPGLASESVQLASGWDELGKAVHKISADEQNQHSTCKCPRKGDNQVFSKDSHSFSALSLRSLVFSISVTLFCISVKFVNIKATFFSEHGTSPTLGGGQWSYPRTWYCSAVPWLLDNQNALWGLGEWWLSYLGF
jgi:hypothetical protein